MSEIEELRAQIRLLGRMFSEFVTCQPTLPEGCADQPSLTSCYLEAVRQELESRLPTHPSLVGCSVRVRLTEDDCDVLVYLPPYGVKPSQAAVKALQDWVSYEFAHCATLAQNMTGIDLGYWPSNRTVAFEFVAPAAAHKRPGRKKRA